MSRKIVVVGGGYGGVELIRQLINRGVKNVEVELFSDKKYFENIIGGPELISERVAVEELRYDLKELSRFWNFQLHVNEVKNVDLENKIINFENGELEYDIIVLASGSQTNFYNVEGASNSLPAYSLEDFLRINQAVKSVSEESNIVVVGAGFVGLEVVGYILDVLKSIGKKSNISVVEQATSVLSTYPNELARSIAFKYFSKKDVKFILGQRVKALESNKIIFANKNHVQADVIVWAAGIRSSNLSFNVKGAKLVNGFIKVDERLFIKGKDDAFALGDVAYVEIDGKVAQKMAGEALEQAKTVAKNISYILERSKPNLTHKVVFSTDFPQALLSVGDDKAILIYGQNYASIGTVEYFLKKRIDFDEIMGRFP